MSPLSRSSLVVLAGVAFIVACGDSSTGPRAGSVTGIAGDGQFGPTGQTLPIPLSFVVLTTGGTPLANANVTWRVVSGAATVNPTSSRTDTTGFASTTVTLGTTTGPVLVTGTVSGVDPVEFDLEVLNPCDYTAPYTFTSTVNGALTTSDCRIAPGYYYDYYGFTVGSQQGLVATMNASFDTFLDLYGAPGDTLDFIGANDDVSSTNLNSLLQAIVAPGNYALGANTAFQNVTGSYTISTFTRPQTVANCEVVWFTRGVSISETLATTDCPDSIGGGIGYGDAVGIIARPGSILTLSQKSTAVDAMLTLYRADSTGLNPVASNDDSAATTNDAFINYSVDRFAVFVVFIGTAAPGQTGAYTFSIGAAATASGLSGAATSATAVPKVFFPEAWRLLPRGRGRRY